MTKKTSVIGVGIWGTALAITAQRAGNEVLCWAREDEVVQSINNQHVNHLFLPDIPLPEHIQATSDIQKAIEFSDILLLVVSSQHTRSILETIKPFIGNNKTIVLCAKGIEIKTGCILSEVLQQVMPGQICAVLSGGGFAYEVALKKPTAVTIACPEKGCTQKLVETMGSQYFRPYSSNDIISPQIGGSVKNVIAIASGCVEGLNLGDNARAALITRGLSEMTRLAKALGGHMHTMMGMCGLGDLILTANCTQSRNFSFGFELGQKGNAQEILQNNTRTIEGIYTAPAVLKRAHELNVEMPICEMVNAVLNGKPLERAIDELLSRPFKNEDI